MNGEEGGSRVTYQRSNVLIIIIYVGRKWIKTIM